MLQFYYLLVDVAFLSVTAIRRSGVPILDELKENPPGHFLIRGAPSALAEARSMPWTPSKFFMNAYPGMK
jgi:hypothetical protein